MGLGAGGPGSPSSIELGPGGTGVAQSCGTGTRGTTVTYRLGSHGLGRGGEGGGLPCCRGCGITAPYIAYGVRGQSCPLPRTPGPGPAPDPGRVTSPVSRGTAPGRGLTGPLRAPQPVAPAAWGPGRPTSRRAPARRPPTPHLEVVAAEVDAADEGQDPGGRHGGAGGGRAGGPGGRPAPPRR